MLGQLVEEATKTVLESIPLADRGNAAVHISFGTNTLTPPYVRVATEDGDEELLDTGNFAVRTQVEIVSFADEAPAAHNLRAAHVYVKCMNGTFAEELTAARDNFHCYGITNRGFSKAEVEGERRQFISTVSFTAHCCGRDLV